MFENTVRNSEKGSSEEKWIQKRAAGFAGRELFTCRTGLEEEEEVLSISSRIKELLSLTTFAQKPMDQQFTRYLFPFSQLNWVK